MDCTISGKESRKAIYTILKLSDYILPKLTKIEISEEPKDMFDVLTEEELDSELIKMVEEIGHKVS